MGDIRCWRCGAGLAALSLPLARLDECPECLVHVHVCRMCIHFDPATTRQCKEDDAEDVKEKERANFCDYFKPSADAFDPQLADAETAALNQLDTIFGGAAEADSPAGKAPGSESADDLFK